MIKPKVQFIPPISWTVRRTVKDTLYALMEFIPVRHKLIIKVIPYTSVIFTYPNGSYCPVFGAFDANKKPWTITIAGIIHPYIYNTDEEMDEKEFLQRTVIHEMIHYEQLRDGKRLTHQGLPLREDYLFRKITNE